MKEEKLSKKQADFIKFYLETGNGTKAALKAYDTDDYMTAHSIAVENLQKPTIKSYIEAMMDEAGFDDSYLKNMHKKLLESENPSIVLKALDMAYKLKGSYTRGKLTVINEPIAEEKRKITIEDVAAFWERAEKAAKERDKELNEKYELPTD